MHGGVGAGYCYYVGGYEYGNYNVPPGYRSNVNDRYMMMAQRPPYPMPNSNAVTADYATHLFSDENTNGCFIM